MSALTLTDILARFAALHELPKRWRHIVEVRVEAAPDEVEAWITENLRGRLCGKAGVYGFEDEIDATAFKTRWG